MGQKQSNSCCTQDDAAPNVAAATCGKKERSIAVPANGHEEPGRPTVTKPKRTRRATIQGALAAGYDFGPRIGEGAYSKVYLASTLTGREVAVKVIKKEAMGETDRVGLDREMALLRAIDHPHVIQLVDTFEEAGHLYIVTELMRGGGLLEHILDRKVYAEGDARRLLRTLADTLAYLHGRGIVHRDLKLDNVLLTTKGPAAELKIADFGLARDVEGLGSSGAAATCCGTPAYAAPEIVLSARYGAKVDVWSLGVMAYIMLGGAPPFRGDNQQALFADIVAGAYDFDGKNWDAVSAEGKAFVRAMLTVDPEARPAAADVAAHPWLAVSSSGKHLGASVRRMQEYHHHASSRRAGLPTGPADDEEEDEEEDEPPPMLCASKR